jgi:hypothetical protein
MTLEADLRRLQDRTILIVDIERLPGLAPVWQQKTRYVPVSTWRRLPSMLCFAAKWYGKRTVEFHAAWDDIDAMVERSHAMYDAADIVVTYNGIAFDDKHLRGAWIRAGLAPPSPWKQVDLFRHAAQFGFESRSLAHLLHLLQLPSKSGHYDAVMAERALDGDERAQRVLRRYNVGDVKATEAAYERLLPWIKSHPHVSSIRGGDEIVCPRCGSRAVQRSGEVIANVHSYARWTCSDCRGHFRGQHLRRVANTFAL